MFPNGKVILTDAEYTALMEHDRRQANTITEQNARIAELKSGLAKWGDHASNCAYRLAHYKGPVPACDCGWNEHVASLTPNGGGSEHG